MDLRKPTLEGLVDYKDAFAGKRVFITGNTGFKGSWLTLWLQKIGASVKGYALAPETTPNHFESIELTCETVIADIRDAERLTKEMSSFKPDLVFHMAAQPLVKRSYRQPVYTYQTNVMGTLNVLEAARVSQPGAVVIITTDKVYENKEWHWAYKETDRLGGYDIYSSSKACTEILVHSYQQSFLPLDKYQIEHKTLIATVRAGNVVGGGDWSEDRLIPDIVKATAANKKVEIRNPKAIRPWQHVLDPLSGYLTVAYFLLKGSKETAKAWNFGPDNHAMRSVEEVMLAMKRHWHAVNPIFPDQSNQPHEANLLKIDSSMAINELNWKPTWGFDKSISLTAEWYRAYYENNEVNTLAQLDIYESDLINAR